MGEGVVSVVMLDPGRADAKYHLRCYSLHSLLRPDEDVDEMHEVRDPNLPNLGFALDTGRSYRKKMLQFSFERRNDDNL